MPYIKREQVLPQVRNPWQKKRFNKQTSSLTHGGPPPAWKDTELWIQQNGSQTGYNGKIWSKLDQGRPEQEDETRRNTRLKIAMARREMTCEREANPKISHRPKRNTRKSSYRKTKPSFRLRKQKNGRAPPPQQTRKKSKAKESKQTHQPEVQRTAGVQAKQIEGRK